MINAFRYLLDFFYPHICLVCGSKITFEYGRPPLATDIVSNPRVGADIFCCQKCKLQIIYAPSHKIITAELHNFFGEEKLAITSALSLFSNSKDFPIINLIYELKYHGITDIGKHYGQWLGEELLRNKMNDYNFIVPVPIHKTRKRERGYNQSEYIAAGVNKVLHIPVRTDCIYKSRHTISQTRLNATERTSNLDDAFELAGNVKDKRILLVDDVLTTGTTANNCAATLIRGGAKQVDVGTLLKA
jgi:ComF family protein